MLPTIPIILSGGSGTRLWPLSRKSYPKQFIDLPEIPRSLLQTTARRFSEAAYEAPLIIGNLEHRFVLADQLSAIGLEPRAMILEPVGRNTAPAAITAALWITKHVGDAIMVLAPSDHRIEREDAFHEVITRAIDSARSDKIALLGIKPDSPHEGFGYIERGDPVACASGCYDVVGFVEKPSLKIAEELVASGRHYWNSGMFVFRATRLIDEAERLVPDMLEACQRALTHARTDDFYIALEHEAFAECAAESIDRAIIENCGDRHVTEADIGWRDLGSWQSLWEISHKDKANNVSVGDVVSRESSDNLVIADSRLVMTLGVNNLVVVDTPDALLVADRDQSGNISEHVRSLQERTEVLKNRREYRPWGYFETMGTDPSFHVKRLVIEPGHSISLQRHTHRAEHWVVVEGTASVIKGDQTITLETNQSTFIPAGAIHRLSSSGSKRVVVIEVQTGSYFGEDDIERFEDSYGRTES